MKTLVTILMFISSTAFADAPTAYYVASSILKDSGIDDASNVSGTHVGSDRGGDVLNTTHILHFNHAGQSFTCDYEFSAQRIRQDHYVVEAELSGCRNDASGAVLVLQNDYTSRSGVSTFRRLFFDNNSKFRPLSSEDRELAERRSDRAFRDGAVRIVNPRGTDRIILFDGQSVIPIN